jgi:hypothetical protein
MSSYPPPSDGNDLRFNPLNFQTLFEGLSIFDGDKRYLRLSGGSITGSLTIGGTLTVDGNEISPPPDYVLSITEGLASPSKALVLDSGSNITNINSLTSRYLKLDNSSTTLLTNSSLDTSYGLCLRSNTSSNGIHPGSSISFITDSLSGIPMSSITLDRISSAAGDLCFSTRNGSLNDERMRIKASGNICIGINSDVYKLNVNGSLNCNSLYISNILQDFSNLTYLDVTPGTAEPSKALVLNSSGTISDIPSMIIRGSTFSKSLSVVNTTTTNTASINIQSYYPLEIGITGTSGSPANTGFIKIGTTNALLIDSTAHMAIYTSINTSYRLNVGGALNCSSFYISGALQDLSNLGLLDVTLGTASASKVLTTDASYGLVGLRSLSVSGGTLSKSVVIQNDNMSSAASMNFVSYYQMEQGVRGSTSSTTPNCYFWRYALSDVLIVDLSGRFAINTNISTSYRFNIGGPLNCTSLYVSGALQDLSKLSLLDVTLGTASASKALTTDASYGLTGLRSLAIKDSTLSKSLVIQNDNMASAASMNFVSYYQGEVGVRGSSYSGSANKFFIRYALSDCLTIDSTGTVDIPNGLTVGGQSITPASNIFTIANSAYNTSSKVDQYNLVARQAYNTVQAWSGIAFNLDTGSTSDSTPAAAITAFKTTSDIYDGADIRFYTKGIASQASAVSLRMVIDKQGPISFGAIQGDGDLNLITGTSNNRFRIGSYLANNNCFTMQWTYASYGSTNNYLSFDNYGSTNNLVLSATNRVGVGGNVPTSKLHVFGTNSGTDLYGSWVRVQEWQNSRSPPIKAGLIIYDEIGGTYNNGISFGTYTDDNINFMVNGGNKMQLNTSGRLAVNRTNPEAVIHAGGQIYADQQFYSKVNSSSAIYSWNWIYSNYPAIGNDSTASTMRIGTCNGSYAWQAYMNVRGGSYTNASDRRLKTDIIDIPYGLETVLQMKPKKFKMIQDKSEHIGLIAQDMVKLIPECVLGEETENDELNDEGLPIDAMGIDYASLVSVLAKAIQEQDEKIAKLFELLNKK